MSSGATRSRDIWSRVRGSPRPGGEGSLKSPKVCIGDSGIVHSLLGVGDARDLGRHPKVGASWEGFLLHQILERLGAAPEECFYANYPSPWKSWTLVEAMDNKLGRRFNKA